MKIIILGAGQVGRTAAYHLSREEANEVTVVDSNEAVLRDLQDRLDVRTLSGNAASPAVLEAAGCADANLLVALTSSDEVNMVACHVAWTLFKTPTKIARIRAAAYGSRPELFSDSAGFAVDVWLSPEQLVTEYVEQLIRHPGALQVVDFADGRVRLVGVRAVEGGLLVGQPLSNLPRHIPGIDARVAAIYRKGRSIKPEGGTVVEPNDEVFFLAAREDIRTVMSELRKLEGPIRRLVIAGGGNIGIRLAQALESQNQVKLIERDPRRARYASEVLRNTIVLEGDAADEELLLEENVDGADAFVAVTNAEEANILSAMLAKRLGCGKVMALINKPSYAELMESDRIDIAISPQTITIGSLLAYVRRGDVARVHSLRRGAAEAIEAIAHGDSETSKVVGRAVEAIRLPEGTTIGAIVRGDEVLMGHHDIVIAEGDHVILFLTDRRHVEAVEKLFQAGVSFI
ncbi:MAG: Trk system potassium transporter TrkA [Proteobacteria bacterium]|nr:Trk system potassium transporter TrkA [Pseudomonadota bacterium]